MEQKQYQTKSKFQLHFYGFLLSSTGWFFGYGLTLFNTFSTEFLKYVYDVSDEQEGQEICGNFQFFFNFGGLICCLFFGKIYEKFGRFKVIIILLILNIVCMLLYIIPNLNLLYFCRVFHGFLSCAYAIVAILIITENLPKKIANVWSPAFYIFLTFGILTSYLFSSEKSAHLWRLIFCLPILMDIPRLLILLKVYRMESPIWQYYQYENDKALETILYENYLYIYDEKTAELKAQELITQRMEYEKRQNNQKKVSLLSKSYRVQFCLVMYLNLLTQLTGALYLSQYSSNVYSDLNVNNPNTLTFYLGIVTFLSSIAGVLLLQYFDLRDLIISGLFLQEIGFVFLLIGYLFNTGLLAVGSSYVYMFGYAISIGTCLYPYQTQILSARGIAIASVTQWISASINGKFAMKVVNTFGIFGSTTILSQEAPTQPPAQQPPIELPTEEKKEEPIQVPTKEPIQQQEQTDPKPVVQTQPVKPLEECNQMLVQSYGLIGYKNPRSDVMLNMCPTIRKTCCTQGDQLEMYGQYIASKKIDNIKDWTEQMKNLHSTVLDVFLETEKYAKRILEQQKNKKTGNCKLLAERIVSFDTTDQIKFIKKIFEKQQKFLQEAWAGFYCSICNYDYHQYFKTTKTRIYQSQGFCRGIVENVLQNQLYIHIHFNKLANLTSRFMSSCDFKGVYEVGVKIPEKVLFPIDDKYKDSVDHLLECKKFRNEKDWVVYCKKLCSKFNIAKVNLFFAGDSVKITEFIEYIKKKAKIWDDDQKSQPVLQMGEDDEDEEPARILSLTDQKKSVKKLLHAKRRLNFSKKDPLLYPPKLGGIVNLQLYLTETSEQGINFQATGNATVITEEMFKIVKQMVQQQMQKF